MKANELMLGDWVANTNGDIGKVEGIIPHDDGHGPEIVVRYSPSGTAYSDVKVLRPIPLTPEILKKNGFGYIEFDEECTHYYLGKPRYCANMELHIGSNRKGSVYWLNYFHSTIRGLKYVHELQHAMRLCWIEKDIEL